MATSMLAEPFAALPIQVKSLPGMRRVHIDESETAVTLTGTVSSYYQKQLAQEAILPLLHGRKLHNRIAVVRG